MLIDIGDTSIHLPKFLHKSFAATFLPNFFATKIFIMVISI